MWGGERESAQNGTRLHTHTHTPHISRPPPTLFPQVYTIYSILAIVFAILLIVTAAVTVALTFFQLASEDHRWWWRSFATGGSTAFWVAGYAVYYYVHQSDMGGALQASFYFGYTFVACAALFVLLGFVGWRASLAFVRAIYKAVKSE